MEYVIRNIIQNRKDESSKNSSSREFGRSHTMVRMKPEAGESCDPDEQEADHAADVFVEKVAMCSLSDQEQVNYSSVSTPVSKESPSVFLQTLFSLYENGGSMAIPKSRILEETYGQDLSGTVIHVDSDAAVANGLLGSQAFSSGNDIFFNQGRFQPHSKDGLRLLGHELSHVSKFKSCIDMENLVNFNPVLDAKIQTGEVLSNEDIRKLRTRKQRADYLYGSNADKALNKERVFGTYSDAEADMRTVKVNVHGSDLTINMRVHWKLEAYVKEMFDQIYAEYSGPNPPDNFEWHGKNKDGGAFNWRYSRNDIQDNQQRIDENKRMLDSLNLSEEAYDLLEQTVSLNKKSQGKQRAEMEKQLQQMIGDEIGNRAIYLNERINSLKSAEGDSTSEIDYSEQDDYLNSLEYFESELQNLNLGRTDGKNARTAATEENEKKRDKARKALISSVGSSVGKQAIGYYEKILKYERSKQSIEAKDKELTEAIQKMMSDNNEQITAKDNLEAEKEPLLHRLKTIKGMQNGGTKISETIQTELDRISGTEVSELVAATKKDFNIKIQVEQSRLDEYLRHKELRNSSDEVIAEELARLKKDSQSSVKESDYRRYVNRRDNPKKRKDSDEDKILSYEKKIKAEHEMELWNKEISVIDDSINAIQDIIRGLESDRDAVNENDILEKISILEKELAAQIELENGLEGKDLKQELNATQKSIDSLNKSIKAVDKSISKNTDNIEKNKKKMSSYVSSRFSEHSSGIAIDINPVYNKFYQDGENIENEYIGTEFDKYTLKKDSQIVKIFESYGWKWGGDWKGRDYMHFEWFSKTWPRE